MASIPNSESSSFTGAISRPRPVSPNMQTSKANNPAGQITPSTSFSAPSSQDLPPGKPEILSGHVPVQQPEGQTHVRVSPLPSDVAYTPQSPITPVSVQPEARKVPNKRMANGEVKQATQSPLSPIGPQMRSSNSSATSRNIQISELSNQLRTRLSYAMVKVQNGWQAHSFDELESLSQQVSPVSAASDLRQPYGSPRLNIPDAGEQIRFSQSSERTTATPENVTPFAQAYTRASPLDNPSSQVVSSSQPTSMATYESFWRQHSTSSTMKSPQMQSPPPRIGPSLAPPADILPRNRRRTTSLRTQPPFLDTAYNASYDSRSTNSLGSVTSPATPPKRMSSIRTPSQKAAMEQDAVETLVFMSSPGHSGHHPQTRSIGTPLRSSFKRVGFTDVSENGSDEDRPHPLPNKPFSRTGRLKSDRLVSGADVDRLLDEMPDEDSSEDEIDSHLKIQC